MKKLSGDPWINLSKFGTFSSPIQVIDVVECDIAKSALEIPDECEDKRAYRTDHVRETLFQMENHVYVWVYAPEKDEQPNISLNTAKFAICASIFEKGIPDESTYECSNWLRSKSFVALVNNCALCFRYFTVKCMNGHVYLCTECFDRLLTAAADKREEQVSREWSGLVAGIVSREGHDELIQKHINLRKKKRKRSAEEEK